MSEKSDIVQELREMSMNLLKPYSQLAREAANEIERLRKATLAPSAAWDGYLVSGMSDSVDEVLRLVAENKRLRTLKTGEIGRPQEKLP